MTDLDDMSEAQLRFRIMVVRKAINWLNSDDPYIVEHDKLGELLPKAKAIYEEQLEQLQEALSKKMTPQQQIVGLKQANLKARRK